MREETRKSLKRNSPFLVFAIIIIGLIFLSDITEISLDELKLVIILMAFFILAQVFSQAFQYEREETRKKTVTISVAIMVTILFLGVLYYTFLR